MKSIGIIGLGVVGTAVKEGMEHSFRVKWNDKDDGDPVFQLVQVVEGPIFVCVPTPTGQDGLSCDASIVEEVVREVSRAGKYTYKNPILAIKSTVPVGTTERLNRTYPYVDICFNPEFLTEKNAGNDFKNQDRIVIGGNALACKAVSECYQKAYPNVEQVICNSGEAEMAKYMTNVYLGIKVSVANEFKQICDGLGINYDTAIEIAKKDVRLGTTHWSVPGPDGQLGFGGSCFPKDVRAIVSMAFGVNVYPALALAAINKNKEVRKNEE